jgi:hypothetical protein
MTAGFLTRLAERALHGVQPPMVRPDLPPAFTPGLLTRASEPDLEETGIAGTSPAEADPIWPNGPESGGWSASIGSDLDLPPSRDVAKVPPSGPVIPGRSAEPEAHEPEPEVWHPPAQHEPSHQPTAVAPERYRQRPRPAADASRTATGENRVAPDDAAAAPGRPDIPAVARAAPEPEDIWRQAPMLSTGAVGPASQAPRLPPPASREPDVRISIGRIEVRLEEAPVAPPRVQRPPRAEPALSLEEYLRRRSESSR